MVFVRNQAHLDISARILSQLLAGQRKVTCPAGGSQRLLLKSIALGCFKHVVVVPGGLGKVKNFGKHRQVHQLARLNAVEHGFGDDARHKLLVGHFEEVNVLLLVQVGGFPVRKLSLALLLVSDHVVAHQTQFFQFFEVAVQAYFLCIAHEPLYFVHLRNGLLEHAWLLEHARLQIESRRSHCVEAAVKLLQILLVALLIFNRNPRGNRLKLLHLHRVSRTVKEVLFGRKKSGEHRNFDQFQVAAGHNEFAGPLRTDTPFFTRQFDEGRIYLL